MKNWEKIRILITLAVFSAGILLISNLAATKLWDFCGIAVDGGVLIFPLSYIIGDLIIELYDKKVANYIIYIGFGLNLLAVLVFWAVGVLPEYASWNGQEAYQTILGFAPRVIFGSLIAYLTSGLMNNLVFERIRARTGDAKMWVRFLGSSAVAHLFDSLIFETVAFLGVLSFEEFLVQAGFAYLAGIILEIILTPISYWVVKKLRKYEIRDKINAEETRRN